MKSNAKAKTIILIALGILFALLPMIAVNLSFITGNSNKGLDYNNVINLDKENLKISAVSEKIHIDNNWTAAKAAGICTGNGTYTEPYVIEDLVIDGGGSGSCILIKNSDVYFKIENCSVYNSGGYPNAGIRLSNVSNSQLVNNTCSSNYRGIRIESCNNNSISGNLANDNNWYGIDLYYSDDNTVLGNAANDNGDGIYLWNSKGNLISANVVNNNFDGIYLSSSDYNNISGNTVNYNDEGIIFHSSNNNTISGNIMNKCGLCIVQPSLEALLSNEVDSTNLVNGKPLYYYTNKVNLGVTDFFNAGQVILVKCNDSLISNSNVSYGSTGISLYYCNNNTISGNTAHNSSQTGISLSSSNDNTISGNTVNYNDEAIILSSSNDNTISGNTVNYNDEGIILSSSNYNNILGNTAHNNSKGISLTDSNSNDISGNTAHNNSKGISLTDSNRNDISGNTVNYSGEGIFLSLSDYNNILGNTVRNNSRGIELICSSKNKISQNIIMGNGVGIYSWYLYWICEKPSNEIFNNTFSGNGVDIIIYTDPSESGGFPMVDLMRVGLILLVVAGVIFSLLIEYGLNKGRKTKVKKSRLPKDEVARYKKLKELEGKSTRNHDEFPDQIET